MFADDTQLDTAEKPTFSHILEAKFNNDLNKLNEYLNYDILSLNIQRCEFMLICTYQAMS